MKKQPTETPVANVIGLSHPVETSADVTLQGELANAYKEFAEAATDVEGKTKAAQAAQERYRNAVGRLGQLAGAVMTKG